jgi:hypothetical protein
MVATIFEQTRRTNLNTYPKLGVRFPSPPRTQPSRLIPLGPSLEQPRPTPRPPTPGPLRPSRPESHHSRLLLRKQRRHHVRTALDRCAQPARSLRRPCSR